MPRSDATAHLLASILLIALGIGTYLAALSGGFFFDDHANLVRAPGWKAMSLAPGELLEAANSGQTSDGGRPLAMLSFAINHATTGLDPWWLKATSLAFHLINGLLVLVLARRLLAAGTRIDGRTLIVASWLAAATWLVHPIQVSTVAYIVQRMELGAATGILLTLLFYIRFRDCRLSARRAWPWLAAACAGTAFGLGFKESAAIAPVLAIMVEALCFGFRARSGGLDRPLVLVYGAGAFVAGVAFVTRVAPLASASAFAPRSFDSTERTLTQFPVLCDYLAKIIWPAPDSFRFYYDDFPVSHAITEAGTWPAILVILSLVAVAWFARRRSPLVVFGLAWFFACHAITSSPIPLELAFEHRNYLASLGPILAIASLVASLTRQLNPDARLVASTLPVLALAGLCAIQAATWGNPMRLALTLENRAPGSERAGYGLAMALIESSKGDRASPSWSLGMATLQRASQLPTASPMSSQALIVLSAREGISPPPGTWDRFRAQLTARPLGPEATESLFSVNACRLSGCPLDDAELLATLLATLERNPENATAHTLYANFAWNVLGDRALAIDLQRQAVALSGGAEAFRQGLAEFLLAYGQGDGGATAGQ